MKKLTKNEREKLINSYIDDCVNKAYKYEEDVVNGNIITSKFIKSAVLREKKIRKKYDFDIEKVKDVFRFFYFINIQPNKQYIPLPFQCWIILCIYSLYNAEKRLRKYAIIWIARKNGKTAFTSIISLYELIKGESEAEVYFLATTARQASQGLKYLKSIIDYSPALNKRVESLQYKLRFNKHSTLQPLANNPNKLDGLNPSFAVIDESHSHPNRDLFNIINSGNKARKNPLIFEISTAGYNKSYPFFEQIEIGKSVLEGEINMDNTFYAFFTLDSENEIENSEMWIKANPSLGEIIDIQTLIDDFEKSKKTQSDLDDFIIKNLNYYKDVSSGWIPDEIIVKNSYEFNIEEIYGCEIYLGIDLASTRDLTSLAIIFKKDNKLFAKIENFLPNNSNSIIRMNGLDLSGWITSGYIHRSETQTTDYNYIIERIKYYNDNFEIVSLGYDKWNSSQIIADLQLNMGIYCENIPQTTSHFNMPLRKLESLLFENKIVLEKNPVLRWMFRNVVLFRDSNDNIKIMKNKKKDAVDGVVALAMALSMQNKNNIY